MDDPVLLDCKKNNFLLVNIELSLFFRPGSQGINGQSGLPGIPGAKVNLIDQC